MAVSVESKPWGKKEILHADSVMHIERITVQPGGKCSVHYHAGKDNLFFVLAGALTVRFKTIGAEEWTKEESLDPGDSIWIPAGSVHQFEANSRVVALEVYLPALGELLSADDIERIQEQAKGFASERSHLAIAGTLEDAGRRVEEYRRSKSDKK